MKRTLLVAMFYSETLKILKSCFVDQFKYRNQVVFTGTYLCSAIPGVLDFTNCVISLRVLFSDTDECI